MALVFCCPECGATLRSSRTDTLAVIACVGCNEPVRVPRNSHPAEAAIDVPSVRLVDAELARTGIVRLVCSLWYFGLSGFFSVVLLSMWMAVGARPSDSLPSWLRFLAIVLVALSLAAALFGCYHRVRGYLACQSAAATLRVDGWARLAAWGACLVAAGQLSAMMLYLTRTPNAAPVDLRPLALAGILAGLVGVAMEFGFLTVLHRLLWETSGWQAAGRTGQFALTFLFATVISMAVVYAGMLALSRLHVQDGDGLTTARQMRTVFIVMLSGLAGLVAVVTIRYGQLLQATRRALRQPAAYPVEKSSPAA